MRFLPRAIRPIVFLTIGSGLAFISAALSAPIQTQLTPTPLAITPTATPLVQTGSVAGTTDGILLIATVIVLIVIIPILWKRSEWSHA